jgi:hypothetical protein
MRVASIFVGRKAIVERGWFVTGAVGTSDAGGEEGEDEAGSPLGADVAPPHAAVAVVRSRSRRVESVRVFTGRAESNRRAASCPRRARAFPQIDACHRAPRVRRVCAARLGAGGRRVGVGSNGERIAPDPAPATR